MRKMILLMALPAVALAADPLPQSAADLAQRRGQMGPGTELFGARAPASAPAKAPRPPAAAPAIVQPAPPQAPALPFGYGGSGRVNGKRVLFLERDGRSLRVEAGDVVDGAYRVEALEQNRAVLRYLPMNIAQVMVFGSPEKTASVSAVARQRLQGPLVLDVPDEAPLDREVPVVLSIPPGSLATKATVTLNFDDNALSITGAKIVRPGRAVVEVSAQDAIRSKELRLKPLGSEVSSTEIAIDVIAFDAQGRSLAVRLPPHHLSLVEAVN